MNLANKLTLARVVMIPVFLVLLYLDFRGHLYVALAVFNHQTDGQMVLSWPMAMPAAAIVLLFLAHKGIQHDEKLVRSLDRIR